MSGVPQAKSGRKQRRALVVGGLVATAVIVGAVPEIMLAHGSSEAERCLAKYEAPRGPERPACQKSLSWLIFPARVPWTANRARYRAEELGARIALQDYVDAAVGSPSESRIVETASALERAAKVVEEGSQRVSFDELGRSAPAPELGRDATLHGDRRALLARGESWLHWQTRITTLRAALLEADPKRADLFANRYADYDPRDHDSRTTIAAVLCLGEGNQRGFEMLPFVEEDRADRRYEGLSRDFGDVHALLVACAARASAKPPPLPQNPKAGSADAVELRALVALLVPKPPPGQAPILAGPVMTAIARAKGLLQSGPRSRGARATLLGAILAAGAPLEADAILELARARDDEPDFCASPAETALDWLSERRPGLGDEEPPALGTGAMFVAATQRLAALEPKSKELDAVRGALALEAASALAREGDVEGGLRAADEAASALTMAAHTRALARSNVLWLGGKRARAFAELELDVAPASDEPDEGGRWDERVLAAVAMQRAELAASLGKRDEAKTAAERAEERAIAAHDVRMSARARWLLAALGAREKATPPSWEDLEAGRAFPWMGYANPLAPDLAGDEATQAARQNRVLDAWVGLAAADAPLRRAARFAALRDRGDAPPWLATHLLLIGQLLAPGEGDVEVLLDALTALDLPRFSLRSYAFARAEAARMRGDPDAASTWDARYRFLQGLIADPTRVLIARYLDL